MKDIKRNLRSRTINIGTWNIRTMLELGKLQLLLQELDTLHIGITGLCEHRWKNDGKFTNGNHTIYFSGNEKGGSNGVAIILDKQYADAVKSFKPVNDRLLSLK